MSNPNMMSGFSVVAAFIALTFSLNAAFGDIELIKTISIPGSTTDRSGLEAPLQEGIPHNLFGGISALDYSGSEDLYFALPDRGPKDGAVDWICRVHLIRVATNGNSNTEFGIEKTILLSDGERQFSGLATRYSASADKTSRFDPEGIRVGRNGDFFISDEYGPHLIEFNSSGQKIRSLELPGRYLIAHPRATKAEENKANQSGRQSNRGVEGLAINQQSDRLYGLFQSPLLQDCDLSGQKPIGLNCRLFELDVISGTKREMLYPLEHKKNKLNEILRYSDQEFLVIERDGKAGAEAKFKKIMKINVADSDDIQDVDRLPVEGLPPGLQPIRKTEFIDLLDPRFGLLGAAMPEKIEGLALGPDLPDGRKTLLVMSDNDFMEDQPTLIYCFAIGDAPSGKESTSR